MTTNETEYEISGRWDDRVVPDAVNVLGWTMRVRATNAIQTGWLVWHAHAIDCCQQGWPAEKQPGLFDTSGCGTYNAVGHVQCGGCGSLLMPAVEIVTSSGDDDTDADAVSDAIEAILEENAS